MKREISIDDNFESINLGKKLSIIGDEFNEELMNTKKPITGSLSQQEIINGLSVTLINQSYEQEECNELEYELSTRNIIYENNF
ncbi:unnamed protein product [Schistosoma turkestanicum]|nr:unnamed protein product [Schistosoma turkestanicum]